MTSRDQMRAADADRERMAERLRAALEEGRLSLDELDERLRDVYAATTFGDLDRVAADLPGSAAVEHSAVASAPARPVPPSRHEENPKLAPWLAVLWRLWLATVSVCLVIWLVVSIAVGELVYFWPGWVAAPWGAVNVGLMIVFPPRRRI